MTNKIPVHTIPERFQSEIAIMHYVSGREIEPSISYAHKDDYYIFLLIENGYGKMMIDFQEYEIKARMVHYILPGQVHGPMGAVSACGWILAIDSMMVKQEYKEVFEKVSLIENKIEPDKTTLDYLNRCASIIHQKMNADKNYFQQQIVHDLLSAYIGMIAEICQKGFPIALYNRLAIITFEFKSLLSTHYKTLKRPSQYASRLNISAIYLNEAVKKTTGSTVSSLIRNEIIIQAKRLLYYTSMSVKEIALELGYEDWAYFTRLFTKSTKLTPTQFRKQYRQTPLTQL